MPDKVAKSITSQTPENMKNSLEKLKQLQDSGTTEAITELAKKATNFIANPFTSLID